MAKSREITTTLHGATRLNSSVNGNPRFTLHTSDGDFTISSDAGVGYEVTNFTNAIQDENPPRVVLSLTPAGRFYAMRYAEPHEEIILDTFAWEWGELTPEQQAAVRADVAEMLTDEASLLKDKEDRLERMAQYKRDLTPPDKFPGYLARYADTLNARQ